MDKLPLTLAMFVRNEERNIRDAIESVYPIVREVVIVDGMSEDGTVEIARKYTDRVYQIPFPGSFGMLRTITAHLASSHWILLLDADERILSSDWDSLVSLIDQPMGTSEHPDKEDGEIIIDSWALPRKRWLDSWMTRQVDIESYPDWQVRLFRNHIYCPKIKFVRRVHETVYGAIRTEQTKAVTIHHFQNQNKTSEQLRERALLYRRLYELDLADGVEHTEPPVVAEDDV